jgi:hypothetical protein
MRATRERAGSFLLALLVCLFAAAAAPAAASLPPLPGSFSDKPRELLDAARIAGLERASATSPASSTRQAPAQVGGFSLWPQGPSGYGELFPREREQLLDLVDVAELEIVSVDLASLPETRVRAFSLFDPDSQPPSNRVSSGTASAFTLGLAGDRVGRATTNLYAFVGHQPNMATDPMGLSALSAAQGVVNSVCSAVGADCGSVEDAWAVAGAGVEGAWEGTKGAASGAVKGLWEIGRVAVTEGPGAAAKMVADNTLDAVVNAPENLANWLEYMNTATPEQAAREFGRLGGGMAVSVIGPAAVGKVVGVGARAAGRGVKAAGRGLGIGGFDAPGPNRTIWGGQFDAPCSFAAGTEVATANGLVPIEEIGVGDFVRSYDEATGYVGLGEVLGLSRRNVEELWLLTVSDETIEASEEHPFYVVGRGWVEVRDLRVWDQLITEGGEWVGLERVERIERAGTVYNFEVAGLHSYFVGEAGVLGHNCNISPATGPANARRGNRFERRVLESLGATKNKDIYIGLIEPGVYRTTIPDVVAPGRIGILDAKDVRYATYSRQLRAQAELADFMNESFSLVISPRTRRVSVTLQRAVQDSGGRIFEFDPRKGVFRNVRFDPSQPYLISR